MSMFTVASRGICHPQWISHFYPEDIPVDWRLSFFANEFNACVLTLSELNTLECKISELPDELPEGFKCYIELDCMPSDEMALQGFSAISGVLISEGCDVDDVFCEWLISVGKPIGFLDMKGASEILPACHIFEYLEQLHCHLISPNEALNLRDLKIRLQSLNCSSDQLVVLDSESLITQFRNVQTLAQLLCADASSY